MVTEGGTRRYSAGDMDRLRRIGDLLDAGLNLAGISMVIDLETQNSQLRADKEEEQQWLTTASISASNPTKRTSKTSNPAPSATSDRHRASRGQAQVTAQSHAVGRPDMQQLVGGVSGRPLAALLLAERVHPGAITYAKKRGSALSSAPPTGPLSRGTAPPTAGPPRASEGR